MLKTLPLLALQLLILTEQMPGLKESMKGGGVDNETILKTALQTANPFPRHHILQVIAKLYIFLIYFPPSYPPSTLAVFFPSIVKV